MNKRHIVLATAIVCSVAAAYVSHRLMLKHVTGKSDASWFDLGCSDEAGPGNANCAAVLASPYSYMPPRTGDRKGGFPVAFLGLVYYTALGVWFVGVGAPSRERRRLHFLPMLTVGLGLAGSAYFMLIMFGKLDQWCTWCLVTHALNLMIAVCVVLLWPRAVAVEAGATSTVRPESKRTSIAVAHPSRRLVLVTTLAIVAAGYAELNLLGIKSWRRTAEDRQALIGRYDAELRRLKSDGGLFVSMWEAQNAVTITRRVDDPVRHKNGDDVEPLDVVVFSDFECPSCARFALFFEQNVVPLFGGHIRATFKHYPIDQACNSLVSRTLHPYACGAAKMAEAARLAGGNAAFWRAHDYLYRSRSALAAGRVGVEDVASAVGVESSALSAQMDSELISTRIAEDIALAGTLGVRGTPAVYVEGKPVDQLAKVEVAFWDTMADDYFRRIGIARPASTRPQKNGATPSSRGRRVAP